MIHYECKGFEKKISQPFSVLMSVYYKEKAENLRVSLESILVHQTVKPKEVVLVKDGPLGDNLNALINEFVEQFPNNIKVIELSKNKGLATALKIGLEECSYDIVARMDSDDISVEDRFEKQLKAMQLGGYDVVGSNTLYFNDETRTLAGIKEKPKTMEQIVTYAKRRSPVAHVTAMFKKDSVLAVGGYDNIVQFEDYWLWIKMIMAGMQIYSIQEPLVLVRYNSQMMNRRGGLRYLRLEIKFLKMVKDTGFYSSKDYFSNLIIRTTARLMPNLLRKFLYSKFLRKAIDPNIAEKYLSKLKERGIF